MKRKRFKRQKDIIKYAVENTIRKHDVEKPKRVNQVREKIDEKRKDKNWLAWAQRKLGE